MSCASPGSAGDVYFYADYSVPAVQYCSFFPCSYCRLNRRFLCSLLLKAVRSLGLAYLRQQVRQTRKNGYRELNCLYGWIIFANDTNCYPVTVDEGSRGYLEMFASIPAEMPGNGIWVR